jgi:methionine synthase II (cobalamin-independent)
MAKVEFNCLPTMIGSEPYIDAAKACEVTLRYLKDIPAWPQLSKRSFLENMYVQYSEGFPGIVVRDEKIFVDKSRDFDKSLETLYAAYLENDIYRFPISADYAAGLHQFLTYSGLHVKAVKGQVVGPVSWGMTVTDNEGRAIAYDDVLADAAAKLLKLKAAWMEAELRKISPNTLIFVDEPYLHSIGSAFFALSNDKVISLIKEVFSGVSGLKGIHCCGQSDWSVILKTGLDILNFDAYNYAQSLALYPQDVKRFISEGGIIAWGIVPNETDTLNRETVNSILDRLEEAISPLTRQGFDFSFRRLIAQSLVTPSCGIGGLSPEGAERVLELLIELSGKVRSKWA